ncbi:MAG: putative toxin-antitoxin system toxin component, PIN family [Candidatus Doudnabacteria bacterium RIFCSPHIGHO2_12_FULL_48_11]|uniref:Putative toxin-antitoxin system toxin component, PIN family n=1 Tax=Candidatus Doudnabacteria bacterium RIFCSPHIGHO2_01_FULL_46_24 TaxID=1817825 RepID=A0A1F5NSU3_9BACT|nr:MAG: putative toxin-antitoxin system toxin component, PIN family [Candidatus Doudnabacteria bacterium RIFCSPHIGHO2_01_FULL_46_24]OGE94016.1 MAG: putative toxin-antitoxin system toxin component, PIN family [Candidatus Doudnabacteria bacterium RIFCSPHIGHO2_12_FULL_48_11]
MLPLRLVIDTNILISGLLKPEGLEHAILFFSLTPPATWFISSQVLDEYQEVSSRSELRIKPKRRRELFALIHSRTITIEPDIKINFLIDPKDDKFLECAEAARADYLISGNLKHFPKFWKTTKIISAREFIEGVVLHLDTK